MLTDNEKFNAQVKPNTAFLTELKSKLPEFFDREGNFDMGKFRQQLAEKNINELKDGYQLNFIGKDYARRQAGEMPTTVIVPDEEQNQGAGKDSHNLFFTGDNLEVLRHLQANYAGKVDVIYIDPPYNTGNGDFVYPDAFEYSDKQLHDMLGMSDDQIERLKSIQGKSSHSAWLTFMYPRLQLAKRLLKQTGVIFISIDDNEQANLKELMDDIFGESNSVANITWRRQDGQSNIGSLAKVKEYILIYSKSDYFNIGRLPLSEKAKKDYKYHDKRGYYGRGRLREPVRGHFNYDVRTPSGHIARGPWLVSKDEFMKLKEKDLIHWPEKKGGSPRRKIYLKDMIDKGQIPNDFWGIEYGTNQRGSLEVQNLFGERYFNFPKPTSLIKMLVKIGGNRHVTVMDFFAGSATTADAVMQLNAEDGGHRKFIMVQLPEPTFTTNSDGKEVPTKGGKAAYDAGFRSIDEISRERIRRAAAKIKADNELTLPADFDGSFKHYRVVKPTKQLLLEIEDFDPQGTALFNDMLNSYASDALDVAGGATGAQTILTTWLAKDGYAFDTETKHVDLAGYQATLVNDNRLYLINPGWGAKNTEALLNQLGTYQLDVQAVVLFGYSFNIAELRELENGLKQVDRHISLIKRY
ncbi:MAG: DNA methyltransferase [Ligilactobacillus saerimneri]|nr:DNA methyltransferase [Ligilactobacillus saerimneri]